MIADYTWYLIFRHVMGEPAHHSLGGVIDAVATESVDRAVEIARTRNPVRGCEYLEALPVTRDKWERAKQIRLRRERENRDFLELMESMDLIIEESDQ